MCNFHYLGYYCSPNLSIHQNSTQELTWNFLVTLDESNLFHFQNFLLSKIQEDIGENAAQIAGTIFNISSIGNTISDIDGDIQDNAAQIEVLKPLKQKTKKLTKDLDQAEADMLNIQVHNFRV